MNRQQISWKKGNTGWFPRFINLARTSLSNSHECLSRVTFGLIRSDARSKQSRDQIRMPAPPRISLAYQFERAAQVVEDAVSRGDAIQALNKQTAQQLDATEYALHRLFDEIHSVLPRFEKPVYDNAIIRTGEAESFRPTALAA